MRRAEKISDVDVLIELEKPIGFVKFIKLENRISDILGINPSRPIREQKPDLFPDRKALDDIVFDVLSLKEDERNED